MCTRGWFCWVETGEEEGGGKKEGTVPTFSSLWQGAAVSTMGKRRATGAIPIQAVMQRQCCIFTAFAVAPNKPGRAF